MKGRKNVLGFVLVLVVIAVAVLTVKLVTVNAKSSGNTDKYKYFTSYEIQPGDTLYSIAEEYTAGTDISIKEYIKEVKKNNNMTDDKIVSGMYIIVSYYSDTYK